MAFEINIPAIYYLEIEGNDVLHNGYSRQIDKERLFWYPGIYVIEFHVY